VAQIYRPQRTKKAAIKTITLTAQVVGLDHQGRGIVRAQQGTYFIPDSLPGEAVHVRLGKPPHAELIRVVAPSPLRETPKCQHYQSCGGCDLQHLAHAQQLTHKHQVVSELLQKFAATQPAAWAAPLTVGAWQTRTRTRLACYYDRTRKQLQIGLRARQQKTIVALQECPVLAPQLAALIAHLSEALSGLQLAPSLGHIELMLAPRPLVLLRLTKPLSEGDRAQLSQLTLNGEAIQWWVQHADDQLESIGGHVLPQYQSCHAGEPLALAFLPGDFVQANGSLNPLMVAQAIAWLESTNGDTILELFAGTGNFTVPLLMSGAEVLAVEGSARMTAQITANTPANLRSGLQVQVADLTQALPRAVRQWPANKLLLDPARAGAQQVLTELLQTLKWSPQRIVYVSCAPDTFARDTKILKQAGYSLARCGIVDMFPQTHHIEVMGLFIKE